MRLFISYARVDKPFCKQIIDLLDMHDVWYDQRLHIGQKWWDQITYRLDWCDGFVYLLSPDSVASEYCRNEVSLAISKGKKILPVLIQAGTKVPPELAQYQWADFSGGLDVSAVKSLLTAIFIAERQLKLEVAAVGAPVPVATPVSAPAPMPQSVMPKVDGSVLLDEAVIAFRQCDYDKTVRLLKEVQESGYMSRFIDVPSMLRQADTALKRQAYEREAQREYAPIANMMKDASTRVLGCTAFRAFQMTFPDYDPENLKQIYDQTVLTQPPFDLQKAMPLLEWCHIPPGKSLTGRARKATDLGEYFISKYPITNAQFQAFIDASDGYKNPAWWQSSLEVRRWHNDHPKAIEAPAGKENHPRADVCWYEAAAFCQWLSYKTGWTVKLPTEQQWQRSGQGDSSARYPWGSRYDQSLVNTKESEIKATTPVTQYPKAASPYGVCDLLGNVWEWCANGHASGEITDVTVDILRSVRGGSFMSPRKHASMNFHYVLNPLYRYKSIGFRVVCETGAEFLNI